ncbi:MAG TPA: hypothetical protein VFD89_04100 [Clostridia bacterium]|nr:hypothetical protein [Clostridia bacterium]
MKRLFILLFTSILIASLIGCANSTVPQKRVPPKPEGNPVKKSDPPADPPKPSGESVPGPWPDRIEIKTGKKVKVNTYSIEGETVYIDPKGKETRGKITMVLKNTKGKWTVSQFDTEQENKSSLVYKNTEFGFSFNLPLTWKGYRIIEGGWESNDKAQSGPSISIRHPKWTEDVPRQDIPIMIFTHEQWDLVEKEKLAVGAAPIGPRMLVENKKFVFALPPRYNFSFLEGFEEVEKIIEDNPLKAND